MACFGNKLCILISLVVVQRSSTPAPHSSAEISTSTLSVVIVLNPQLVRWKWAVKLKTTLLRLDLLTRLFLVNHYRNKKQLRQCTAFVSWKITLTCFPSLYFTFLNFQILLLQQSSVLVLQRIYRVGQSLTHTFTKPDHHLNVIPSKLTPAPDTFHFSKGWLQVLRPQC